MMYCSLWWVSWGSTNDCFHGIVTFRELAENDLNNIRFSFLDPDSMHRCLDTGNVGK